jgi:hypothetical protein
MEMGKGNRWFAIIVRGEDARWLHDAGADDTMKSGMKAEVWRSKMTKEN